MSYNREYYEKHKEEMKKARDKYRKGDSEALERTRTINRERYRNLPIEKKKAIFDRQRKKREQNIELTRVQYRIDARKKMLKKYLMEYEELEERMFRLKMVDTWDSSDYRYSNELFEKMRKVKEKIDKKNYEIEELNKEKERM